MYLYAIYLIHRGKNLLPPLLFSIVLEFLNHPKLRLGIKKANKIIDEMIISIKKKSKKEKLG